MKKAESMTRLLTFIVIAGSLAFMALGVMAMSPPRAAPAVEAEVDYPEGYRRWTQVRSTVVGPASPFFATFGGFHTVYANDIAMQGYETGVFPDGSILVVDLREGPITDRGVDAGAQKRLDVMVRDHAAFPTTDGWGYASFMGPGNRTVRRFAQAEAATRCHACHTRRRAQDFVFSSYEE